jgi:hypothetical protein
MESELKVIADIYHIVNADMVGKHNDSKNRYNSTQILLKHLTTRLSDYKIRVTCDQTLNPPEVVDNNIMVARIEWLTPSRFDKHVNYIDLRFGDPKFVI